MFVGPYGAQRSLSNLPISITRTHMLNTTTVMQQANCLPPFQYYIHCIYVSCKCHSYFIVQNHVRFLVLLPVFLVLLRDS